MTLSSLKASSVNSENAITRVVTRATGLRQQNLFPTRSVTYRGLGRAWPCSPTEPESLSDQKSPPPHRRSHPQVWRGADKAGSWAVWEPSRDREPLAPVGAHQQWRGRCRRHSRRLPCGAPLRWERGGGEADSESWHSWSKKSRLFVCLPCPPIENCERVRSPPDWEIAGTAGRWRLLARKPLLNRAAAPSTARCPW